jgi:hypothetical protein
MANVISQALATMSKNPFHVSYVKSWLHQYAGESISAAQMNDVFTNLYNSYYYWVHDRGYPFPVVTSGGNFSDSAKSLRNEISGQTGYVQNVVNQFLYAIITGYNQGKLSKEFAFPRDDKEWVAGSTAGTFTKKETETPPKQNGITWIPETWVNPAEPKKDGSLLTYGILAALAAGVFFYSKKKGR